ncbi:probable serine/threonine-protein kinase tsuA [Trifolium pratense]|nr:probable serine/threonine-protein kinase tsuA [Trifolium pratense]
MNMCSNSGSTSGCGCGSGGGHGGNGNGNNNGVSMWSSSLKKQQQQQQQQQQKRPRIPKRGPGVAELEKILREQESSIDVTTNDRGINNEGFSVSSSCLFPHFSSSCLKSHQPLPPPPPPPHPSQRLNSINFPPKFDNVMPPSIGSMYGNSNGNTHSLGRNSGGGGGGGSGEHELFPRNLNFSSCKSKPNLNEAADGSQSDSGNSPSSDSNHANWNYPATIQKRNNGYPPQPMINQFHGNGGNQASSGSLSIGLHNHIEPPSIQNNSYYNYPSRSQDENKMVGMKRSHSSTLNNGPIEPSSLNNGLIEPSDFQVIPSFSNLNRPQQSSRNDNHGVSSYNLPTNECYRDARWGSTLELSSKRFNSENGACSGHANFPPFVAPEVPPPPMHLFQNVHPKGNMFPCQAIEDKIESSYQRSESSEQDRKRFFNFLEVKGQEGVTEETSGSNHGGREGGRGGGGGLDLSLKL